MIFAPWLAALTLTCLAAAPAQEPAQQAPLQDRVAELQLDLATRAGTERDLKRVDRLIVESLASALNQLKAEQEPPAALIDDLAALFIARLDLRIALGHGEKARAEILEPGFLVLRDREEQLSALLREIAKHPELVARASGSRQSGSSGGVDWLDDVLEPWAATWIRAQFGVVDREVYERVESNLNRFNGGPVERWEVAPLFILLLQWDCTRVVVDVGTRNMGNTLESLVQSAPEQFASFDRELNQRRGPACDEWLLRALSSASARFIRQPRDLEAMSPVIARLLARRDLELWPAIRNVLSELRGQRELPPDLVRAWSEAVLAADGPRARALLEGFADLQVAVTNPYEARWQGNQPWQADLFRPVLSHAERDIRLIAGSYFAERKDPVLLTWATHADVSHRRLALDVTTKLSGDKDTGSTATDSRLEESWRALLVDPDPALRDRAVESLQSSWILQSDWLQTGLQSPSPTVRGSLAAWIVERATTHSQPSQMAVAQSQVIRRSLQQEPELCAAVLDAVDGRMRGRWAKGPWNTAELARREMLRMMDSPSTDVAARVDEWLATDTSPAGAWFDVLSARVRLPQPLDLNEMFISSRLEQLDAHAEALTLACEARSTSLLLGVLNSLHGGRLRSMFVPLQPADRKWAMVSLWQEAPDRRQAWAPLFAMVGDPALVRALVEDGELPVMLRASAAPLLTSSGEADDRLLLNVAAELAGSNEKWEGSLELQKFPFVDPNGALVRWLSTVPFDPTAGSFVARNARMQVYQWLAPGEVGVQEALVAVVEDHLAHSNSTTNLPLPGSRLTAAASAIRNEVQPRTAAASRRLLEVAPSLEAIQLAAALGVPEAVDGLADFVNGLADSSAHFFRVQAINALRRFPESEVAANAVRMALLSPEGTVVNAASAALDTWSRYRAAGEANAAVPSDAQAVAELFALLNHEQPTLRAEAARGLATLGAAAAIPRLIALLGDTDPAVRTAARESLDRLHTRPLAPAPAKEAPAPAKEPAPPEDS